MLYNDPNDTTQYQSFDPYAQPGHAYGPQQTQPGYPLPVTPGGRPVLPSGIPPWTQPGIPIPQPGMPQAPLAQMGTQQIQFPPKPVRSKTRSVAIFALTCLLAVVFGVGLFSGWTFARSSASNSAPLTSSTSPSTTVSTALDNQTAREEAIAKVAPAVVEIIGQTSRGTALGSGIIVDKNGNIITNAHVVEGISTLHVVLNDGQQVPALLIGTLANNDLAVLRIQPYSGMVVATLGDSSKLTIGQEVLAIGNPLGYNGTVTSGVISALNRTAQESRAVSLTGLIQTSAAINPGNSGGALVNLQGEVVGIPTLAAIDNETNTPANGIGFAIPVNQVKAALRQILD